MPDTRYKLLSVVIPVFNERNVIGELIRRARLVELPIDVEVVVVDDASTDGTDRVLSALEDSTVHVVRHSTNRGKGAAIRTGISAARGDLILVQDADLEYDPSNWERLAMPVLSGRAKVVFGSRYLGERESMPLRLWLGDRSLSVLTSLLYNTAVSDIQTALKLFDRQVLDDLDLQATAFDFEPEVTAKVLRAGHRIYEVPVAYAGRKFSEAEGRKYSGKDRLKAMQTLVRLRLRS